HRARQYLEHKGRLGRWTRARAWYRNEYAAGVVSVNRIFGYGRALVPQPYFKAPDIIVKPRKPLYVQTAKILEASDKWLVKQMGLKHQIKAMILDAYITNIGVAKVGYHSLGTELPTPSDETTQAIAETMGVPPEEFAEEIDRRKWSYHDYIKPDTPWLLRVRPQDLLVPWGFVDEHEAPWHAFRVVRPLDDVKEDPVYGNTRSLQANVKPDYGQPAVMSPNLFGHSPPKGDFVEMFEIWDKRTGKIMVLSQEHDKWVRNEEDNLEITGMAGGVMRFNPDGEDFWGVSDVEQIRKQQDELNENRTHEIESKRISNVKVIVDTNVIPETELDK